MLHPYPAFCSEATGEAIQMSAPRLGFLAVRVFPFQASRALGFPRTRERKTAARCSGKGTQTLPVSSPHLTHWRGLPMGYKNGIRVHGNRPYLNPKPEPRLRPHINTGSQKAAWPDYINGHMSLWLTAHIACALPPISLYSHSHIMAIYLHDSDGKHWFFTSSTITH